MTPAAVFAVPDTAPPAVEPVFWTVLAAVVLVPPRLPARLPATPLTVDPIWDPVLDTTWATVLVPPPGPGTGEPDVHALPMHVVAPLALVGWPEPEPEPGAEP
jgi:hypothetical protein